MALMVIIYSQSLYAAHPLITDDAVTVGKGKAEVEFTFEYSSHKEGGVKENVTEFRRHSDIWFNR